MNHYHLYRNAWCYLGAPHQEQRLEKSQWKTLLRKGGILVRNTYGFDQQKETSFWYLIKDKYQGLEELDSSTRNRIQKANETFEYRCVDRGLILEKGEDLYVETLTGFSQKDIDSYLEDYRFYLDQDETEYWGCFDRSNGELVGFAINYVADQSCDYKIIGILPKYKHNATHVNYGLYHAMTAYYLQERKMRYVTIGTRSITEHSNIQGFLMEKFRFRKAYCLLEIHYKWWVKLAVGLLYPFRKIIKGARVKAILNMEAMKN